MSQPDFLRHTKKGNLAMQTNAQDLNLYVASGAAFAVLSAEDCLSVGQALVARAFEMQARQKEVEPEVLEPEESERRQWAEFGREKELARDAILRPRSNVASDAPSNQPVDAEGA